MKFTYQQSGKTYTIQLEQQSDGRYTATIGDRTYTVDAVALADAGWLIEWGRGRTVSYSAAHKSERYVHADGHTYTLSIPDEQVTRKRGSSTGGELTAQMPGQVVDVLVETGVTVERGQALVIMEAMKMEIRVSAPDDGRVRAVLVARGDIVERGQLLVEIDGTA